MKTIILITLALFGFNSIAEQNVLDCGGNDQEHYNLMQEAYNIKPDVESTYSLGYSSICQGYMAKGVELLEQASDGGHVIASYFMGVYFDKNETFDNNMKPTRDVEGLNAMLYHYERAAQQISSNPGYPHNTFRGIPYTEENGYTSARVFYNIPNSYYRMYLTALRSILNNVEPDVSNDTLVVLNKMQQSAEECMDRPSLAIWGDNQSRVYNVMQVRCEAFSTFAEKTLPLEKERRQIEPTCETPIKECEAHKKIIKQIVAVKNTMVEQFNSVSL